MSYSIVQLKASVITVITFVESADTGRMDVHTERTDEFTGDFIGEAPSRTVSVNVARKMYRSNVLAGFTKL